MVAVRVVVAQGSPFSFSLAVAEPQLQQCSSRGTGLHGWVVVVKGVVSCALLTCGQVLAWWHAADKFIGPHLAVCELRDKCRSLHFLACRWRVGPAEGAFTNCTSMLACCALGGEPF